MIARTAFRLSSQGVTVEAPSASHPDTVPLTATAPQTAALTATTKEG